MSYTIEKGTNDIVIKGFENGIADDPYEGISDMRNINIISVPKEGFVNFSTQSVAPPTITTGTITSVDSGTDTITFSGGVGGIENNMAVVFAGTVPNGVVAGTVYYIKGKSGSTFQLSNVIILTDTVNITNTTTGATFTFFTMASPKFFTYNPVLGQGTTFMVDASGQVWTNSNGTNTSGTASGYWIYTGNNGGTGGGQNGNGLQVYIASNNTQYLFVWRNSAIDYMRCERTTLGNSVWVYGWKPSDGTTANANGSCGLKMGSGANFSHETYLAPDNVVYFCDLQWIGRFFEQTGQVFLPTDITTYIYDETRLLPYTDIAQSLSFLGTNLMIGGQQNVIYPWDTTSPTFSYPILLSEYNVSRMVTVNTTTFIFVGNRGRIYYTNGTNAQLYKKLPDHLSGTIEPYYLWGGATSNKNQLYFSAYVTDNANNVISQYGGVWAVDLDSKAIRLVNKLSYGTYAGYSTAMIPSFAANPAGAGLFIGWYDGTNFGVDKTISTPYTGGESIIDSDLIPIGTFLRPTTNGTMEFKLSVPLVTGETVSMWYRQKFSDSFTQVGSTTTSTTNGAGTTFSDNTQNINFQSSQWVQMRVVLTSTASSPSYCRLTEMRIGSV